MRPLAERCTPLRGAYIYIYICPPPGVLRRYVACLGAVVKALSSGSLSVSLKALLSVSIKALALCCVFRCYQALLSLC